MSHLRPVKPEDVAAILKRVKSSLSHYFSLSTIHFSLDSEYHPNRLFIHHYRQNPQQL